MVNAASEEESSSIEAAAAASSAVTTTTTNNRKSVHAEITRLLKEPEKIDHTTDAARLDELRRIFVRLVQAGEWNLGGRTTKITTLSSAQQKWHMFLTKSHQSLVAQLSRRIRGGQRWAVRTFWGVIAGSPVTSHNGQYQIVSADLLLDLVRSLSSCNNAKDDVPAVLHLDDKSVQNMLRGEFFGPFRDVQYYTMIAIAACAHDLFYETSKKDRN